MKSIRTLLVVSVVLINCIFAKNAKLPSPPRANDLSDHFGTNPSANQYGPRPATLQPGTLQRRGVNENPSITPIKNFDQEIDPKEVVSGDLTNTSPDASKIFKPDYAGK